MKRSSETTFFVTAAVILLGLCSPAAAQQVPASYTTSQAKHGRKAFEAACLACHGPEATGAPTAPTLSGAAFASRWNGRPVGQLARFLRDHMPRSFPGLLNDPTYLALVAYLLAENGVPASSTPLTMDSAEAIRIESR